MAISILVRSSSDHLLHLTICRHPILFFPTLNFWDSLAIQSRLDSNSESACSMSWLLGLQMCATIPGYPSNTSWHSNYVKFSYYNVMDDLNDLIFIVEGCPVQSRVFPYIIGFYWLDTSNLPTESGTTPKHLQMMLNVLGGASAFSVRIYNIRPVREGLILPALELGHASSVLPALELEHASSLSHHFSVSLT